MLCNENRITDILETIRNSPFEFYLTGSRFFSSHVPENSDWDFFVQDLFSDLSLGLPSIYSWLDQNGFIKKEFHPYVDGDNTAEVWERGNVDIQIVKDAKKKNKIQEMAKKRNIEMSKEVWLFAHDLLTFQ